jgi:hypothetical protein
MKTCPLIEDNKAMITIKESWAQVIMGGDIEKKISKSNFSNTYDNWGLALIHSYYMVITLSNNVYNPGEVKPFILPLHEILK